MAERWTDEQKSAINEKGRNIIVSAAAGSGKTSVLSERVCRFVADGGDIERLLVVTFTKAASKEMRSRIRKKIADLCRAEQNPETKKRLRRQLVKVGNAKISTIDSFFGDLVREKFRVAEVSPNFGMLDPAETAAIEQEALAAVVERAYEDMSEPFRALVELVGGDARNEKIGGDIKYIYNRLASVPFRTEWLKTKKELYSSPEYFTSFCCDYIASRVREVLPVFEQIEASGAICSPSKSRYLAEDIESLHRVLSACEKGDWDGARVCAFEGDARGKSKTDDPNAVARYFKVRGYLKNLFALPFMQHSAAAIKRELEEMSVPVSCLFDLVEEYALELRRICEEKNKYTFDIISEKALRLLVASFDHETGIFETTELARAVAANFDGVMIDEYQDTSPLQDVCFAAVGRDDMFVVGDLKQSIYSFRGAKPEGFAKKRDVFRRIDLNKNFRSRKGVLDFANFVFSMIFSEEVGGVEYDDGERLNHGEKTPSEEARQTPDVEIDVLNAEYTEKLGTGSSADFCHVAGRISDLVENGDGERTYRYSDIAVLCADNLSCARVAKTLNSLNVPAYYESGGNIFESVCVRSAVAVLRALNDPYSDVDFYACMTCGVFDVEESDIAQVVAEVGRKGFLYDKITANAAANTRLSAFVSVFEAFRTLAAELPVSALIRRIYEATGYPEKVLLFPNGEERYDALMKFEAFAAAHEEACEARLGKFLKLVSDFAAKGSTDEDSAAPKGEFVRIMTFHKSKGLEFPVCIVPRLEKAFPSKKGDDENIAFHPRFAVGTYLRDAEGTVEAKSFLYSLNERLSADEVLSEKLRVLYVVVTRAKEKLILCANPPKKFSAESLAVLYDYVPQPDGTRKLKCLRLAVENAKSYLDLVALALTHRIDSGIFNCADVPTKPFCEPIRVNSDFENEDGEITERATEASEAETEAVTTLADGKKKRVSGLSETELNRRFGAKLTTLLSKVPAKVSVTELSKGFVADEDAEPMFPQSQKPSVTPEFLSSSEMSGAERGTAVHRFVSLLDLKADPSDELARLVSEGVLSEREAEAVNLEKIRHFLSSDIGELMRNAKKVYREESFVVRIPATEYAADADPNAEILLQGAVDALCETDDGFVLIDYKTDRKTAEELKALYSRQLGYYAYAVEKLFGKPVKKAYIRSFSLDETIEIPLH